MSKPACTLASCANLLSSPSREAATRTTLPRLITPGHIASTYALPEFKAGGRSPNLPTNIQRSVQCFKRSARWFSSVKCLSGSSRPSAHEPLAQRYPCPRVGVGIAPFFPRYFTQSYSLVSLVPLRHARRPSSPNFDSSSRPWLP